MGISTIAESLPSVAELNRVSTALAALDAIVMPDWERRYYSYDVNWGDMEELASMRDGSGNEYSVVFAGGGAFIRGFDHESKLSPWQRMPPSPHVELFQGLPAEFSEYVNEESFTLGGVPAFTSCFWNCGIPGETWHCGMSTGVAADEARESRLFASLLEPSPSFYVQHVQEIYEHSLDLNSVTMFYEFVPATRALILAVNPDSDVEVVQQELSELGYPVAA